jgi:hypothetical protein
VNDETNKGEDTVDHKLKLAAAIGAAAILTITGVTTYAAEIKVLSTQATVLQNQA